MGPAELTRLLVESFDFQESLSAEAALKRILVNIGLNEYEAAVEAERRAPGVLLLLRQEESTTLPFDVSSSDPHRLVGKGRTRRDDTPRTVELRERLALVDDLLLSIYECGDSVFESMSAKMLRESGAIETFVTAPSNDGGIDIYGRIPLRLQAPDVPKSLLRTTILSKELLILGQCKCYEPSAAIGRPAIDQYHGQLKACLEQYEGNPILPPNRVPSRYYQRNEASLTILLTTAGFSEQALGAASSYDMLLVNGRAIAEYLAYLGVGVTSNSSGKARISREAILDWTNR